MIVAFTGHRDRYCPEAELEALLLPYRYDLWITGGAKGFDWQVFCFCARHRIAFREYRPDWQRHPRAAPFIRNRLLVDHCDLLCACYDGRQEGGTAYTVDYANKKGVTVHFLNPIPLSSSLRSSTAAQHHHPELDFG